MNIEKSETTNNNELDSKELKDLFQNIFSMIEETFLVNSKPIVPEIVSFLKDFLTVAKTFTGIKNPLTPDENKIFFEIDKDFLKNFFVLIGKVENIDETNIFVDLLGLIMGSNPFIISPMCWKDLVSIVENGISGDNDVEIFKALSKTFHIIPSSAAKRLIAGDFFEFIKILFESIEEDIFTLTAPLFRAILEFLISTKLNISFQQALIQNKIHVILYLIIKNAYQPGKSSHIHSFLQENSKLFVAIIVNCLSKADKDTYNEFMNQLLFGFIPYQTHKFQEEVLSPILYTNTILDVVPVHVQFQDNNIRFEDLGFDKGQTDKNFEPFVSKNDLFKETLKSYFGSDLNLYWRELDTFPKRRREFEEPPCFIFEFFIHNQTSFAKLIVLLISKSSKFIQLEDKVIKGNSDNYLFWYENNQLQLISNQMHFVIWNSDPLKPKIYLNGSVITFDDYILTLSPTFFKPISNQNENIGKFLKNGHVFKSDIALWNAYPIYHLNQFENDSFKQFNSFSSTQNERLFLLPSKSTLEEFLLILFKNDPAKIKSLRLSLNQENVGMHIKLSDLIAKEKSDFLKISIKSLDNAIEPNLILPPEEVLEVALIKSNSQPWNLISRCPRFSHQQIFPTLYQMISNIYNKNIRLYQRYVILAEKFSSLIPVLETLLGKKLYALILWFLFNENELDVDMEIFMRTILYGLARNDLKQCLPVDLFTLLNYILSNTNQIEQHDKILILFILEQTYELGLIKDRRFIESFVNTLIWKEEIITGINFQMQEIFKQYDKRILVLMNKKFLESEKLLQNNQNSIS